MVEITHNAEAFDRAMREVPDKLYKNLLDAFKTHHMRFLNHFKRTRMRSSQLNAGVQTRSGALRRSFDMAASGAHLDSLSVSTFSAGSKYARIQEEGGKIEAPPGRYLAVPLKAAKTAAGVQRKPPRQWNDTFFLKSKKGTLLLMQKRGADMIPLFAMVKKVTIPGNLGFHQTWKEELPKFYKLVDKAVRKSLKPDPVVKP